VGAHQEDDHRDHQGRDVESILIFIICSYICVGLIFVDVIIMSKGGIYPIKPFVTHVCKEMYGFFFEYIPSWFFILFISDNA
jgi:hypothetical protein